MNVHAELLKIIQSTGDNELKEHLTSQVLNSLDVTSLGDTIDALTPDRYPFEKNCGWCSQCKRLGAQTGDSKAVRCMNSTAGWQSEDIRKMEPGEKKDQLIQKYMKAWKQ